MKDKPITIVEHLGELRRRMIYILISVAITSAIAGYFREEIKSFIMAGGNIESLVTISPTEAFIVIVKLCILAGVMGAMPFIFYQIWKYVGVALKKKERKYLIFFGPVSYILFFCGAAFAFRAVLPLAIKFLRKFSSAGIITMWSLNAYVSFLSKMIIAFGLMFELPLVILLLSKLGLVTPQSLKKGLKYAILVIFVVAAVLTPPDVISQIMLAVPILLLYLVGIWICHVVTKKREREMGVEEAVVNEA